MSGDNNPRSCAVAYLRRSTDRQERSLNDQLVAIQSYADTHSLSLLRTYTDDAVSGVRSDTRQAFQRMIQDAQRSDNGFRTILVFDIKRIGRVDNDEAGHYRWLLRQAGVRVVYIADGLGGGTLDNLIRPVITTIDADGVALAAIQGLHQLIKDKDAEIAALKSRIEAIEAAMRHH